MRGCIDEGILQSYFDGELSSKMTESVSSHIASCIACAQAARQLESESVLLSRALEPEFTGPVPTDRLRHRLDVAIAGLQVVRPASTDGSRARGWLQSIVDLLTLSPQRAFGYACLAAVILSASILAIVQRRRALVYNSDAVAAIREGRTTAPVAATGRSPEAVTPPADDKQQKEKLVRNQARTAPVRRSLNRSELTAKQVKLLPGERSYLQTIASLDTTIKSESNSPMRPGLQAEYERNLALVDRAIAATRSAAKNNPNDTDAAEFMFAAYQGKVDLLNLVADARLSNRQH